MATERVVTGSERRRRRRRHRIDAGLQRDEAAGEGDAQPPGLADAIFDRPVDIPSLREARLASMATPAAARKKMQLEYQRARSAKVATTARPKSPKPTSRSIFGRRSSVLTTRSKLKAGDAKKEEDSAVIDRRDFQKEHDKDAKNVAKPTVERRKTSTSTTAKPKLERRKTESAAALRRSSTTAPTRPQIRKSTTSASVSKVKVAADQKPADQDTVISKAKSTQSQRNSSILGTLFNKPPPVAEKQVSCLTCGSDDIPVSRSAKLPCDHRMCHSCLKRIFKMSINDPAHMPPRCCTDKHISLKHVDSLFNNEFKETWNKKFKEYNAKNRIYCPRIGCGEWIQPKHMRLEHGRKVGLCPKCKYGVCAICNQKAHRSRECPKDPAMKQLNEIAEQEGWRKCYNCSAMVELKEGCNHMTCRCMAEFCMCCGLKWKSCDCPWFNYEAVDDLRGNPLRHQQEMDRRAEQLHRDEEVARQMAGLNVRGQPRNRFNVEVLEAENAAPHQMNENFLQQAREALTANYQDAEFAARGLLDGWLTGRENPLPGGMPRGLDEQTQNLRQYPAVFGNPIGRRRTSRLR